MRAFEFEQALSRRVWECKYRLGEEASFADTAARVARAVAAAEPDDADGWARRFRDLLSSGRFLPGGRILASAGSGSTRTLCNCFVMGPIEDSMAGIFDALRDGATTLQLGGGVGYDFSTLRPAGMAAQASTNVASGPVSFMHLWDAMSATVVSTSGRRGAMMATLRCDHPDVPRFITAKQAPGVLTHFNLSVQVTAAFMQAVHDDRPWPLRFPDPAAAGERLPWAGFPEPVSCRIHTALPARELWQQIVECAWQTGDPGVLFVDRINAANTLWYREQISATNPCGEVPLPAWGACNLGSLNLPQFVRDPFGHAASVDRDALLDTARLAVRFLDNVIDISGYPLPPQADQARGTRRIGLGVTGLADTLCLLGLRYDSDTARTWARELIRDLRDAVYAASADLAAAKGPFPWFEREPYLAGQFVQTLPAALRDRIGRHGIRNSHLLALAPAGSISLLANDVSSGIEPIFAERYRRRINVPGGAEEFEQTARVLRQWQQHGGTAARPPAFVTAAAIAPEDHVRMQAALQPCVDGAISKTVRLQHSATHADVDSLLQLADRSALKGITVFRDRPERPGVLADACPLPGAAETR